MQENSCNTSDFLMHTLFNIQVLAAVAEFGSSIFQSRIMLPCPEEFQDIPYLLKLHQFDSFQFSYDDLQTEQVLEVHVEC